MSYTFGPLTDDFGEDLTTASDGSGGLILSCPKYGSMTVTASQLADPLTARLVQRLTAAEDFYITWRNLSQQIGLGDPGEAQLGSPE